ncbi:MAG: 2-C-methyl-D-erythritol 4-phosphate cytidylyltransferase [Candidatus Hydrogenedentota bacterium]
MERVQLLIPAAGMGQRLGAGRPKALIQLAGQPLLIWTLSRFDALGLADGAVIVGPPESRAEMEQALTAAFSEYRFTWADGGSERQISVCNGLDALRPDTEIVVIHDAARPFVPESAIRASIEAAREFGAATVAIPSIDTILVGDDDAFLVNTPDRARLWACQTPQTFRVSVIREAHAKAGEEDHLGTDDATLVRRSGGRVKLVQGSPLNFKVTTREDLALAERVIAGGLS